MTINGQTLTLKLSLTLPSLITPSGTALRTSLWISKLFKIEGAGQIDFCGYQLLLLTQSENMIGKHRPSPAHLWVSACSSLFLMGCWWAAALDFRDWSRTCKSLTVKKVFQNNQQDADLPLFSWDLWVWGHRLPRWCLIFHALASPLM